MQQALSHEQQVNNLRMAQEQLKANNLALQQQLQQGWSNFTDKVSAYIKDPASYYAIGGLLAGLFFCYFLFKHGIPWLLLPRPKIIIDANLGLWDRLTGSHYSFKFADFIGSEQLKARLQRLIKENRKVVATPQASFSHMLAYGVPGTGKTFFARILARESGMRYVLFSGAHIAQLSEEQALQQLQKVIDYARSQRNVLIIIDEVETMLGNRSNTTNTKSIQLTQMFLALFEKPLDPSVQLYLITNHPSQLDPAVLSRVSRTKIIRFDMPTAEVATALFKHFLGKFLLKRTDKHFWSKIMPELIAQLQQLPTQGLVGRDIEAICYEFSALPPHAKGDSAAALKALQELVELAIATKKEAASFALTEAMTAEAA